MVTPNAISQKEIINTSMEKILNTGQIIFACKGTNIKKNKFNIEYKNYIYNSNLINSIWLSQNKPCVGNFKIEKPKTFPIKWKVLKDQYLECYSRVPKKDKLNVLQSHLQYIPKNVNEIIKNKLFKLSFLPSRVNILEYTKEHKINKNLAKWLLLNANNKDVNINIIEVDNYSPEILEAIIKVNIIKSDSINNT